METYLVGGAVRDRLLGLPVLEKDWVVVGSNSQAMIDAGYTQVGSDFPVFLHPQTKQEYALARTERKTGPGHTGFDCIADESVTLVQDLSRRDLTVNAIAESPHGEIIDPFHGQADIKNRVLRHVSTAFSEDPLRVLRVARFLAKLAPMGFSVCAETETLCRQMVDAGELDELTPERVFAELEKALATPRPARFFEFLGLIGADQMLWPALATNDLARLASLQDNATREQRFAVTFMHCSEEEVTALKGRVALPQRYLSLTRAMHLVSERWRSATLAGDYVSVMYDVDAFRRREAFDEFVATCALLHDDPDKESRWRQLLEVALSVGFDDVDEKLKGPDIAKAIRDKRVERIAANL